MVEIIPFPVSGSRAPGRPTARNSSAAIELSNDGKRARVNRRISREYFAALWEAEYGRETPFD